MIATDLSRMAMTSCSVNGARFSCSWRRRTDTKLGMKTGINASVVMRGANGLTLPVSEPAPIAHSMTSSRTRRVRCNGMVRLHDTVKYFKLSKAAVKVDLGPALPKNVIASESEARKAGRTEKVGRGIHSREDTKKSRTAGYCDGRRVVGPHCCASLTDSKGRTGLQSAPGWYPAPEQRHRRSKTTKQICYTAENGKTAWSASVGCRACFGGRVIDNRRG